MTTETKIGLVRKCIECGEQATKKAIMDTSTATHIMYYCADHAPDPSK